MTVVIFTAFFLLITWLGVVFFGPPYVPTLRRDLTTLFAELGLDKRHHFVDLGAGDGRVLRAAAATGAAVSGVELNPFLVAAARFRLRAARRARVQLGSIWRYDLPRDTTDVFLFPAEAYLARFETYLSQQAQTRSFRVIVYAFRFKQHRIKRSIGPFHIYQF